MNEKFNNRLPLKVSRARLGYLILCFCLLTQVTLAQVTIDGNTRHASTKANRERGLDMLGEIKRVIKANYYDPKFRGINIDERFKLAAVRIKTLNTYSQIFREIAQTVVDFNDSHTRFLPPPWANRPEYGFSLQMIGDTCYLVDVKKGSEANAKGLKVGDVVLALGQYAVTRENLWKLNYLLYQIDPQEVLTLSVQSPDGRKRTVSVRAKFKTPEERLKETRSRDAEKKQRPFKCNEVSTDLIACKLYTFLADRDEMNKMMKEVRRYNKFILDLRGNRGGYVKTVDHLIGYFFYHDVKIGVEVTREKAKESIAKNLKEKAYHGELVVLIDSASASGSEVFARVIQIEKRGKIVGDVSAGAVMTSRVFRLANFSGVYNVLVVGYAVNVSVSDLIMSDGKRLEGIGVMPDDPVGPTGRALLEGNDPVLSRAASLFGVKLTPEQAGKLYFITKQPEDEEIEGKAEDK